MQLKVEAMYAQHLSLSPAGRRDAWSSVTDLGVSHYHLVRSNDACSPNRADGNVKALASEVDPGGTRLYIFAQSNHLPICSGSSS
jgi:hypothetical protein